MDMDDDFGDLYSDVLLPLPSNPPSSAPPAAASPPAASAPPASTAPPTATAPPATGPAASTGDGDDDWLLGGADPPGLEPTSNWSDEEEDEPGRRVSRTDLKEEKTNPRVSAPQAPRDDAADLDESPAIPGLSSAPTAAAVSAPAPGDPAASEDWDSDSEDDLQIVLNETDQGMRMDDAEYEDEDDDLVIVTDGDQIGVQEQDWGEEGAALGVDGEGKEILGGEGGSKGTGVGISGGPGPSRIGYSNHGFHPPPHLSMYKYVRPGAPVPGGGLAGAGGVAGPQGQPRPPLPAGLYPGRGRGSDWRPMAGGRGIMGNSQKGSGFYSGYGMSNWGNSARQFGGGLDFTLPPHKTIFDIDIEGFEEKPWKYPGADVSDYFNFGLDEEKWKDYCKRLDQLRLESTMQTRIRVYESGRSEQEYDPDLPPELAAATGQTEISVDNNGQISKIDNGISGLNRGGAGPTSSRPQLPMGRAIQVESSYVERLPSIDTRPPRIRDPDTIIEIVLQDSIGDSVAEDNDGFDQSEKDSRGDHTLTEYNKMSSSPNRSNSNSHSHSHSHSNFNSNLSGGPHTKKPACGDTEIDEADATGPTREQSGTESREEEEEEKLAYSSGTEIDAVNSQPGEQVESSLHSDRSEKSKSKSKEREEEEEEEEDEREQGQQPISRNRNTNNNDSRSSRKEIVSRTVLESERGSRMGGGMKGREERDTYHHNAYTYAHPHGRDNSMHGFRGRSYDRPREDLLMRPEMMMMTRGRGAACPPGRSFERDEDSRVRKRVEEGEWRGVRKRVRRDEEPIPRREKDVIINNININDNINVRVRDKMAEDHYRSSSKHRDREREEREREKERQRSRHSHEREGVVRRERNSTTSSISKELKMDEGERGDRGKGGREERGSSRQHERAAGPTHDRERHRDSVRKGRVLEPSTTSSDQRKRRHDDKGERKTVGNEQERKKADHSRPSLVPRQQTGEGSDGPTSDEEGSGKDSSRRGRSKLERWTSHKERDYSALDSANAKPPFSVGAASTDLDAAGRDGVPPADSRHLDAVERLKRRSERFKLPMPGEREVPAGSGSSRLESEPGTADVDVKPERPARKRRWTGS